MCAIKHNKNLLLCLNSLLFVADPVYFCCCFLFVSKGCGVGQEAKRVYFHKPESNDQSLVHLGIGQ